MTTSETIRLSSGSTGMKHKHAAISRFPLISMSIPVIFMYTYYYRT